MLLDLTCDISKDFLFPYFHLFAHEAFDLWQLRVGGLADELAVYSVDEPIYRIGVT